MPEDATLFAALQAGRQRFLELVAELRPELHRYAARMTGSVSDAEDVVQETLARAYYALSQVEQAPPLRPWLFRIAHNQALDHLRRYERRHAESLEAAAELPGDAETPESAFARQEATRLSLERFCELVPAQRSAVILKDVLGHSVEEIAAIVELSESAVKAALHRGRQRLRALAGEPSPPRAAARAHSPDLERYAALFNAGDWDGVRALLAEDVELDLVSRARRRGKGDVAIYFTAYASFTGCRVAPAWLARREVLAVFRDPQNPAPSYFVELGFSGGKLARIKDFAHVPYIAAEAKLDLGTPP